MRCRLSSTIAIASVIRITVKTEGRAKSKDVSNVQSKVRGLDPDLTDFCGVRRTMSAGFLVQPGTRFFSFHGALAAASCNLQSLSTACSPKCLFPGGWGVPAPPGLLRAWRASGAPWLAAAGSRPGRRSKCAPSALAASLRRRASQNQCLQRAGWCARARGACVCVRAPVGCVLTKVCLLNPLLGCAFHPECEHPGLKQCLIGEAAGVTRASSSSPAPRRDEGAQGRGCHGPLGTPGAQLRGRFRALSLFSDTSPGSAPSPATRTQRTLSSEPLCAAATRGSGAGALLPHPGLQK